MPLNIPKSYSFLPVPIGEVKLVTRSSRRSRAWIGGTYFRSIERGESANQIRIGVLESGSEGIFIAHHTGLKGNVQVFGPTDLKSNFELMDLNLEWNEVIRISKIGDGSLSVDRYQIRWESGNGETLLNHLGTITPGRVFVAPGRMTAKLEAGTNWSPGQVLEIRPNTHRVTLASRSVPGSEGSMAIQGWDISALRASINSDQNSYVYMPERGSIDPQDTKTDDEILTAFPMTNMSGGDGLPLAPVGFNTGPERVLVHLNYAELDNGTLGEFNQVFEWVGSSSTQGSWQKYS
jgi:hypothetical protein